MRRLLKILAFVLLALVAVALVHQWWAGRPASGTVDDLETSEGAYAALAPEQRRLVDDWTGRFVAATGREMRPEQIYDSLGLSTRTTFTAVTHALSRTSLTTTSGEPMNLTALDLIARVDAVAGRVAGAGGDKQYRLYVQLRPEARRMLEQSREFSRQVDNSVYHKGYPVCFRGVGGTPSIQVSLSADGTRGDIDVDYRASEFPIMLLNGHLTSSNSDVRAGDNDQRHNGRWIGLGNWWRGFMGLVLGEFPSEEAATAVKAVATEPRLGGKAPPADVVFDFLSSWLVDGTPGVAAGYVSPRAFACMELENGVAVDRGVARFRMVAAMQAVNQRLGSIGQLSAGIESVRLDEPRARPIDHARSDVFALYSVRDDLAESFDCENRLRPEQADRKLARSTAFGRVIAAVFRLRTPVRSGEFVVTLWTQDRGRWMLQAYQVESELPAGPLGAPPPPATEAASPVTGGDPDMTQAAIGFFDAWFIRQDAARAFRNLAPESYACYNAFRSEQTPVGGADDLKDLILEQMNRAAEHAGAGQRLEDVLTAVEPQHPNLRIVTHDASAAVAVIALPRAMGEAAACARLNAGQLPQVDDSQPHAYGDYFATSSRFTAAGPDGAVLWTVWARRGAAWQVISFLVVTP